MLDGEEQGGRMIGVVGGLGPYAGLDLVRKIFDETDAPTDQAHLPVALLSVPASVPDRTAFLLGHSDVNPAHAVVRVIQRLEQVGAAVVGIPCNTLHAPAILDVMLRELADTGSTVRFIHMIDQVGDWIRVKYPSVKTVGVLATTGACRAGVYQDVLEARGLTAVCPVAAEQDEVHRAIYDADYGIKAHPGLGTRRARAGLLHAARHLRERGVEAIVLGCTEIPLAMTESAVEGAPLIDATRVLARALVRQVAPEKLRSEQGAGTA